MNIPQRGYTMNESSRICCGGVVYVAARIISFFSACVHKKSLPRMLPKRACEAG
jgi:hypothetical protein